eukprot:2522222-Alexandrium_andersonii.AAC.1
MRLLGLAEKRRRSPENAGERRKTPEAARRKTPENAQRHFSQLHFDPQVLQDFQPGMWRAGEFVDELDTEA